MAAAPAMSSSKVERATGREKERASGGGNGLPSTCRRAAGSTLNAGTVPAPPTRGLDLAARALSRDRWAWSWLMELDRPAQRFGR